MKDYKTEQAINELYRGEYEEQEKECLVCGYTGYVKPNPDGDIVCPECGDPDMGVKEER